MKNISPFLLPFLGLLLCVSSFAQSAPRPLDQLYSGYQASVLSSVDQVNQIFNEMPLVFRPKTWLNGGSQCFHRAEIWSYDFYRNKNIKAMKVFVFYTFAYKQAYRAMTGKNFDWWFHVAPYLLVRDSATPAMKEYVVDPTFAETPMEIAPWGDLFVETGKKCAEFVPYAQFKNEVVGGPDAVVGTEHCYLVRVPAVDFDPSEVEERESGQKTGFYYDLNNVSTAVSQAVYNSSKDYMKQLLGL